MFCQGQYEGQDYMVVVSVGGGEFAGWIVFSVLR